MFFALMMMLTASISANAMSYEQARNEALFLTDKMAYELNLTDEQYEAAYEINLDYLMGVTSRYDVYGTYWERRNLDLSYILYDWQWNAYIAASYFYRPLYWDAGYWHFGIYARYPHRDYFYFGRPHFYHTYRGAHAWHRVGGHGYYHGHSNHYRVSGREHFGMHDRFNRGDFRGNRHSSTRVTAGDRGGRGIGNRSMDRQNRSIERGNRTIERQNRTIERGNRTIERQNRSIERGNRTIERQNHSIDRSRSTYGGSRSSSTFGGSRSSRSSGSFSGGSRSSHSSGSFSGGSRSSHSSGSFSGGSHSSTRSSGGSFSSGSHGGGSHGHSGGGHSGGRAGGRR